MSSYPFRWVSADAAERAERRTVFSQADYSVEADVVRSEPGHVYMPEAFAAMAQDVYNFEPRPDDVWVVTLPKCGTTWTQEIVWQIVHDLDFESSRSTPLLARSPFLEMTTITKGWLDRSPPALKEKFPPMFIDSVDFAAKQPSPRVIKSHMPFEFLPPKLLDTCKVIYVCRNPKDACVSFFHHCNLMPDIYGMGGTVEQFADLFIKGTLNFGDYFYHLKSAWSRRSHPNLHIMWFEDMKRDLPSRLSDLCSFLGRSLTPDKLSLLADHVSIENMRKISEGYPVTSEQEKEVNRKFFRKGEVGDWQNYFKGETLDRWDAWIADSIKNTDIVIPGV